MNYKILTLPETSNQAGQTVPVIPGALDVEKADGYITAYGDFVPGVNTKWMRGPNQVVAFCKQLADGRYLVCSEDAKLAELDPTNAGVKLSDLGTACLTYRLSGTRLDPTSGQPKPFTDLVYTFAVGTVPAKLPSVATPWVLGDLTVTSAEPSIEGTIGGVDMPNVISKNPTVSVVEITK